MSTELTTGPQRTTPAKAASRGLIRPNRCGVHLIIAVLLLLQLSSLSLSKQKTFRWDASSVLVTNRTEQTVHESQRNATMTEQMQCNPAQMNHNYTGKPLFIPAYPGSGSELMSSLIRAISGNGGIDIYNGPLKDASTLTVKTHWPTFRPNMARFTPANLMDVYSKRYAVLVRNPMNALPSYFNYKYEARNKLNGHSTQAPESEWIAFRDQVFASEIKKWKSLFTRWREQESKTQYYERAMILEYEAITASPGPLVQFASELRKLNCTTIVSDEDIRCLWYQVAKAKKSETRREPRKYIPAYTTEQKEGFLKMLEELKQDAILHDDQDVAALAERYQQAIQQSMRIVDETLEG